LKLKGDEVALLVRMRMRAEGIAESARRFGVHPKRRDHIAEAWRRRGWIVDQAMTPEAVGIADGLCRDIRSGADERNVQVGDVLVELAARGSRGQPVAESHKPNARDLVGAAIVDLEWRLERGRRQRSRPTRRQLREARWLLQQAMAVLCGEIQDDKYISPQRGRHQEDTHHDAVSRPPALNATDRNRGAGELYRRTLGGMR